MQSCPPKALMFGDRNDPNSDVSKALLDPRNYNLLEELHTLPGVSYMTKVRNQEAQPTEEKA
jgi:molybdopterin-containing oxidoreductase family iron-sulfur binding subunit